eukprot:IDg18608t1
MIRDGFEFAKRPCHMAELVFQRLEDVREPLRSVLPCTIRSSTPLRNASAHYQYSVLPGVKVGKQSGSYSDPSPVVFNATLIIRAAVETKDGVVYPPLNSH